MPVFLINVTDEFHIPSLSRFGLKRHIFVTNIACRLQLLKRTPAFVLILEQADLPEFPA